MDKKEGMRFAEGKPSEKKTLSDIDEMIAKRQRGRVIDGEVVPKENRMRQLQAKVAERGTLSPKEEDELRRLEFELKGPLYERRG